MTNNSCCRYAVEADNLYRRVVVVHGHAVQAIGLKLRLVNISRFLLVVRVELSVNEQIPDGAAFPAAPDLKHQWVSVLVPDAYRLLGRLSRLHQEQSAISPDERRREHSAPTKPRWILGNLTPCSRLAIVTSIAVSCSSDISVM